jgi:hypothetical protein
MWDIKIIHMEVIRKPLNVDYSKGFNES